MRSALVIAAVLLASAHAHEHDKRGDHQLLAKQRKERAFGKRQDASSASSLDSTVSLTTTTSDGRTTEDGILGRLNSIISTDLPTHSTRSPATTTTTTTTIKTTAKATTTSASSDDDDDDRPVVSIHLFTTTSTARQSSTDAATGKTTSSATKESDAAPIGLSTSVDPSHIAILPSLRVPQLSPITPESDSATSTTDADSSIVTQLKTVAPLLGKPQVSLSLLPDLQTVSLVTSTSPLAVKLGPSPLSSTTSPLVVATPTSVTTPANTVATSSPATTTSSTTSTDDDVDITSVIGDLTSDALTIATVADGVATPTDTTAVSSQTDSSLAPIASTDVASGSAAISDVASTASVAVSGTASASSIAMSADALSGSASASRPQVIISFSVAPSASAASSYSRAPKLSASFVSASASASGVNALAAFGSSLQSIYGPVQTASLLVAPAPSSAVSAPITQDSVVATVAVATQTSSSTPAVPTTWPTKIVPPTETPSTAPDGYTLASLLFAPSLSYGWLLDHPDTASQIFAFMPSLLSQALGVSSAYVQTVAIVPLANGSETQSVWQGYIPTSLVATLQSMLLDPNSALYHGSGVIGQLAMQLDTSLPIDAFAQDNTSASLEADTSNTTSGVHHKMTLVAITSSFGAAVLLLGSFIFLRARHLRRSQQPQQGPVHLTGSDDMREARISTISSLSDGSARSHTSMSQYSRSPDDYDFDWANLGHNQRNNSTVGSNRRIRSDRVSISRPVLQANSLMM